jgi:hypothetical protein
MSIVDYYRGLSSEKKAFFSVANREVGLGVTLEVLAHLAGLPAKIAKSERTALRTLAKARNVQIEI